MSAEEKIDRLNERIARLKIGADLDRARIAELEGKLRYLRAQAIGGYLHPQVVVQNVNDVLYEDGEERE